MLEHIFDPACNNDGISIRVDPGQISLGRTNFLAMDEVRDIVISPIQAALLLLALRKAIDAEYELAVAFDEFKNKPQDGDYGVTV
jgi:hypothetical protein